MEEEKRNIIRSFYFPLAFLTLLWLIRGMEYYFHIDLGFLGVLPLHLKGLIGLITAPLIHGSWSHLLANTFPLLFLSAGLFFFYREIAYKIFFLIYFISGFWLWVFAREGYHIGASGLIYGLASFLFVSGIIRKEPRVLTISMLVVFLYGSMVWGIFPDFLPNPNISWQSHLMGLIAGIILAFYYRKEGPQREKHFWDEEEEEDENPDEQNSEGEGNFKITYQYREKNQS